MDTFSPVNERTAVEDISMESVPRVFHRNEDANPRNSTKLDNVVTNEDMDEEHGLGYAQEDLEDSPTKRRSSFGSRIPPLTVEETQIETSKTFQFSALENIEFKSKEHRESESHTRVSEPPPASITLREYSTPIKLGVTRQIDVPSSLEKFKSLKIGLDSIANSKHSSNPASPISVPVVQNPFSPKPSVVTQADKHSEAYLKALIDESLTDFKKVIRNDIQNLHVEIIKQSLAQQVNSM